MAKAIPDRLVAAAFDSAGNFTLGGYDPIRKQNYVFLNFSGGGYGASHDTDGLSNGSSILSVSKTQPVEIFERLLRSYSRSTRCVRIWEGWEGVGVASG